MKKNIHKPISNLDLKLLDVKFIAIDDNQTYLTQTLHQFKRTKISQLPSLLKPKSKFDKSNYNDTTMIQDSSSIFCQDKRNKTTMESINQIDQSLISNKFRSSQFSCMDSGTNKNISMSLNCQNYNYNASESLGQIQKIKEQIEQRKQKFSKYRNRSLPHVKLQKQSITQKLDEEKELQKYRRKIQLLKKENTLIHKQISSLYRNKINQNKQPLKKIRKIQPFYLAPIDTNISLTDNKQLSYKQQMKDFKDSIYKNSSFDLQSLLEKNQKQSNIQLLSGKTYPQNSQINKKINFYQNLVDSTPFKQQVQEIHKKIISNNLHKNFSQYLINANKRIPQFIKKLRT